MEILFIILLILGYLVIFSVAVLIMRWAFKIEKFEKLQLAQLALLAEMARKQGVDEEVIQDMVSGLDQE